MQCYKNKDACNREQPEKGEEELKKKTYKHPCMGTHVEVIIPRMHNFCINDCP